MGADILNFYKNNLKKTWKLAFYSAFFVGLMVHFYRFTNLIPNRDALYNFYSSQNMVASGRWFLMVACSLGSWFDLPWVNGILSLCFMGATAAIVAEVFRMKNPVVIVLSSGLLVSFPAITGTMAFEYTADGYMLAMVLAATSVCLTRMEYIGKGYWKRAVLSAVCICLTCGIYQAYVSFAYVLAACYFLNELFEKVESSTAKDQKKLDRTMWIWIITQAAVYCAAMAGYYLIWKFCMHSVGVVPVQYQGIDTLGMVSGKSLLRGIWMALHNFTFFFLEWNPLVYGVTVHMLVSVMFLLCFFVGLAVAGWKSGCIRKGKYLAVIVLCLASLPFGCYMWYLASPDVQYHVLMVQSICVLYIFTAVIINRWLKPRYSNVALVVLLAVIFNNSVTANIYYSLLQQSAVKTQALASEVSARIHLQDDGTVKYVMFSGKLDTKYTSAEKKAWDGLRQLGGWGSNKLLYKNILVYRYLSVYTDFTLAYYRENNLPFPVVQENSNAPTDSEMESRFPRLNANEETELAQSEEVRAMPIWPAADSVKKIGDTVVVKFSDLAE